MSDDKEVEAHLLALSQKQIEILRYIKEHSVIVLEKTYPEIGISKANLGRYLQDFERRELVETVPTGNSRIKPRRLTRLGRKVLEKLERSNRTLIISLIEAIESSAEKMAKKIVDSKGGRKKSEEQLLKEIKELTEIKKQFLF
jgi:DNA-binding MarR family transcriptional regulator